MSNIPFLPLTSGDFRFRVKKKKYGGLSDNVMNHANSFRVPHSPRLT